ncbi:MAG: ATP-binding protein [Desulfobacterales bacterium]|jgi:AAA+ ATPase superfamily predicted ATPase
MENPFSYSDYVIGDAFCNREKEQKDLIYFAKNSQNALLYSHRRMGKTSLVHQVIRRLRNARPVVKSVYIDLYGSLDEKDFIDAVLTGLLQLESKIERILKQVAGLKVTGSIDPVTNLPTLAASIAPKEKPEYLEKALALLVSYSKKQKLLVVFDEFQEVAKYSEKGFEKRLRKIIQGHRNISYIFSGSQKHILIEMFDSTKRAFYKMARSYPLRNIEMRHYIDWAQQLFKKKRVKIEKEIIIDIVERCDYQPIYIQQFLFDLWRSGTVSLTVLDSIQNSILISQKAQFVVLWDLLTLNQKKALRLLAETRGEGIYGAEQLQRVGFNSGSVLHRALVSLIEKEILFKNDTFHFQDAMLKKWVESLS